MMLSWLDVFMQEEQRRQQLRDAERAAQIQAALKEIAAADRWQWRVLNALGAWFMNMGCRLQTHVEAARQAVASPQRAMESNPPPARPCP